MKKKPAKKKTAKKVTRTNSYVGARVKLDIRCSDELSQKISGAAESLGTTRNSIVVIATHIFVEKVLNTTERASNKELLETVLKSFSSLG